MAAMPAMLDMLDMPAMLDILVMYPAKFFLGWGRGGGASNPKLDSLSTSHCTL